MPPVATRSSRIYKGLSTPLIAVTTTSVLVSLYETLRQQGILPDAFPRWVCKHFFGLRTFCARFAAFCTAHRT